MTLGETFHVEFTDHSLVPWNGGRRIRSPGEGGVDDAVLGHARGIVAAIERQVLQLVADAVSELRVGPDERSMHLFAVGIEQKLVGIETMSLFGGIGAVDAVAVDLAG